MKESGNRNSVFKKLLMILTLMVLIFFIVADVLQICFYDTLENFPINFKPEIVVTFLASISAIAFAYYILMIEVLRNRNSQDDVFNYINNNYKILIASIVINLVFALILTFVKLDFRHSIIVLYLHFIVNLVLILLALFKRINKNKENIMWTDTVIDKRTENIKKYIESKNILINSKKINDDLVKLQKLYEEAIYNKQLFLQDKIIDKSYSLFKQILSNKPDMAMGASPDNYYSIKESFNKYIYRIIQLSLKDNSNRHLYLFTTILEMFIDCLKCDQEEFYNTLCEEITYAFKSNGFQNQENQLIVLHKRFALYLIDNDDEYEIKSDKRDKWMEYTVKNVDGVAGLAYLKSDTNIMVDVLEVYFSIMLWLTEKRENFFKISNLTENTKRIFAALNAAEKINSNYSKVILLKITDEVIEINDIGITNEFIDFLDSILIVNDNVKSNDILYVITMCIKNLQVTMIDDKTYAKGYRLLKNITLSSINENYESIKETLPDYLRFVDESDTKYEKYINDFKRYIGHAIYKGSLPALLDLFDVIEEIGQRLEKNSKQKQKCLINIYFDSISKSIANDNKEAFNICMGNYISLISYYADNDKISSGLFGDIIDRFESLAELHFDEVKAYYIVSIIEKLKEISGFKIATKKVENSGRVIYGLLNIGISAIEHDNKAVIKTVSNNLGWIGKDSIDRGQVQVLSCVLKAECQMINIYKNINRKDDLVVIFMGTLFIVLGGYAIKDKNVMCEHEIITAIRNIDNIDFLKYSKMLRDNSSNNVASCKSSNKKYLYSIEHANTFYKKLIDSYPALK